MTAGKDLPAGSQFLSNSSQAAQGRVGLAILLPIGAALTSGTRELAVITFKIAASASGVTQVGFGDQPIAKLVGDKDGNNITPGTIFTGGTVTVGAQQNPVPSITSLSPNAATAGGSAFTLTVNGSNFVNGATAQWNGSARTTAFVSAMQLTAQITAADIASAGSASVIVVNPAPGEGVSNALSFTINSSQTTNRAVRVIASSGGAGQTVGAPIELVSQGDENALGFSLTFNPSVLSNPQVALGPDAAGAQFNVNATQAAQGRVGLTLALGAGQTFSQGARRIFIVTFNIAANATGVTPIDISDQPVVRQVSDASARILPANFNGAAVTVTQGIEGDVAPSPGGDGAVGMGDWVQVGRYTAGLDATSSGSEFQRADAAPRESLGDGKLTINIKDRQPQGFNGGG